MSAELLDGKVLAQKIKDQLKAEVASLKKEFGKSPSLVSILIGEQDSVYAYSQKKSAENLGIEYRLDVLPANISQAQLIARIKELNKDSHVHGIMLHKPLPAGVDYRAVAAEISYEKDIEAVNISHMGHLMFGIPTILPCTPAAAMELIYASGIPISGKDAVVVGRSEIVGKPVSLLLLQKGATVTICHSETDKAGRLQEHVSRAEILVAAVGKPNFIKGAWIKKGAVVIDVGINRVGEKIVGDVEFEEAKRHAGFITPVPGGVGAVTVSILMRNTLEAFKEQVKQKAKVH